MLSGAKIIKMENAKQKKSICRTIIFVLGVVMTDGKWKRRQEMSDERITDIPIPNECKNCIFSAFKQFRNDVPERNVGKWIVNRGLYQCSCCKHIWSELWWVESCPMERMYKIMPFCPNCGAVMRKETENDND